MYIVYWFTIAATYFANGWHQSLSLKEEEKISLFNHYHD